MLFELGLIRQNPPPALKDARLRKQEAERDQRKVQPRRPTSRASDEPEAARERGGQVSRYA